MLPSNGAKALSLRDRRPQISRFHQRHRGHRRWAMPSACGRGAHRAGRSAVAHLEPVPHSGPGEAGRSGWSTTRFADTVFFCNSGAEACELAIKVARKYQRDTGHPERYRVIGCNGSFHGRTLATLAAAGATRAYLEGLRPADGRASTMSPSAISTRCAPRSATETAGDHGRAGAGRRRRARPARADYLAGCATIADEFGLLLVYRRGAVRHGPHRASSSPIEWAGVAPDIMAIAKALGGGFPVGACLATERAAVGHGRRARTARPSAAIRWRWRPATPCST